MSVPDTQENRSRCACARCPSFAAGHTGIFCVLGKSKLPVEERGCLCRTCPVHIQYKPEGRAYCLRGLPGG